MPRLRSIQALRALAALSVALYHACQWADCGFLIGAAGVDLFFVISGFVIWLALQDRDLSSADFLGRRLWRVAPPYWIASLAALAVALAWPRLLPEIYPAPGHVLLSLLFVPHLDPLGQPFPLLPVGWSLCYEMVFYLLAAAALVEPVRRRFGRMAWGLVGAMAFGMVFRPAYFLFANPMLMQFLAGAAIARLWIAGRTPRHGAGWGLLAAGLGLFFALSFFDLYASLWRPLLWGAPAALVLAGAVSLEAEGRAPRSRLLARLGEASYSIYLCHWPVVVMVFKLVGPGRAWLSVPLGVGAAVLTGLAFWRFVEQPLLRWGARRLFAPRPALVAQAAE